MSKIDQLKINLNFCLINLVLTTNDTCVNGVNPASKVSNIVEWVTVVIMPKPCVTG
jgi:hypothetical protein